MSLVLDWSRPVKLFIETKHPVRYGALVESKVLALLHRYGIASPASADLSRAVVMSFSAAAVWRIRRAAPMLPTVLLGETSRYLGGGAATTVGATAVGPSIATLREHPELVDRAAAQGRALYCWTVDHYEDVQLLPRHRSGLGGDEPSGPHEGLAAERADGRGTRLEDRSRLRGVEDVLRHRGVGRQRGEQAGPRRRCSTPRPSPSRRW